MIDVLRMFFICFKYMSANTEETGFKQSVSRNIQLVA